MRRNKKECPKCSRLISLSNFNKHVNSCDGYKKNIVVKEEWKQSDGTYKCPYCERKLSKRSLASHMWRKHTEEGKNFKPTLGKKAWNSGKTKKTDKRIKKYAETYKNKVKKRRIYSLSKRAKFI